MTYPDRQKWDQRYRESGTEPRAATVLTDNLHLLPTSGTALDLACGLGGNALLLAEHGLTVEAWDISPVAIEKLNKLAKGLAIKTKVVDVTPTALPENQFDVIVVSYFIDRRLTLAIIAALRPGGLLFYQTFNQHQCGRGPGNPAYRLQENELLTLFAPLTIRYYREETASDVALLIGQKRRAD